MLRYASFEIGTGRVQARGRRLVDVESTGTDAVLVDYGTRAMRARGTAPRMVRRGAYPLTRYAWDCGTQWLPIYGKLIMKAKV